MYNMFMIFFNAIGQVQDLLYYNNGINNNMQYTAEKKNLTVLDILTFRNNNTQ